MTDTPMTPDRFAAVDEVMRTPPWERTPEQIALGTTITMAESIEIIAANAAKVRGAQV